MDDQFNGRTDDDLFADDFEPVQQTYIETIDSKVEEDVTEPVAITPSAGALAEPVFKQVEPAPVPISAPAPASASSPAPAASKPSGLSQSRHATPRSAHPRQQRKQSPKPTKEPPSSSAPPKPESAPTGTTPTVEKAVPTGPAAGTPGSNTAGPNRHLSGANPRQKLTASELEAKMEQMRILNAEKTRKFEQAELDSRSHALAYEKGMEEAWKRRAEEAERRKRGEEERKKLDEEREKNRERKLKAMGSWDQEKTDRMDDDGRRGNFRSLNGGSRGERRGGYGLAGSRYADRDPGGDGAVREFRADEFRGRGYGPRGRGSGRGGGHGRGRGNHHHGEYERRDYDHGKDITPSDSISNGPRAPKPEDFPALPAAPKMIDTSGKPAITNLPSLSPGPNSPPVGKWDDEMEALDAKAKEAAAATAS